MSVSIANVFSKLNINGAFRSENKVSKLLFNSKNVESNWSTFWNKEHYTSFKLNKLDPTFTKYILEKAFMLNILETIEIDFQNDFDRFILISVVWNNPLNNFVGFPVIIVESNIHPNIFGIYF